MKLTVKRKVRRGKGAATIDKCVHCGFSFIGISVFCSSRCEKAFDDMSMSFRMTIDQALAEHGWH